MWIVLLELDVLRSSIVFYAQELRTSLPKAGIRILYELCRRKYADSLLSGATNAMSSSAPMVCAFAVANAAVGVVYELREFDIILSVEIDGHREGFHRTLSLKSRMQAPAHDQT